MKVALRIAAGTLRAVRDEAPRFAELLAARDAGATFYVNLGPHRLARWLPGRDVGARACAAVVRIRDAGFELGLYGWDPVRWVARAAPGGDAWVERAMRSACDAYERLLGERPRTHAAPGWRMSRHAFRLTQRLGFHYCSDTLGRAPYVPMCEGELVACPELPTTLPTIEALAAGGDAAATVHRAILAASAAAPATGHVFAIDAGPGFARTAPVLERLIDGWRILGYELCGLRALAESLDPKALAHHVVAQAPQPGGGTAAVQGEVFLAGDDEVARAGDSRNNALATAAE
jgi:peptidoglycan/xylan/chitin deacetylase (PgdA/CDA1 family)